MKRFSAREFALLCVPVAAVVGVGCRASAPVAPKVEPPPKLTFSMQHPTTLQAFDGIKTVLVAQVSRDSRGAYYRFEEDEPLFWLKIGDDKDAKFWRSDGTGAIAKDTYAPSVWGDASVKLPLKSVPPKPVTFGLDAKVVSTDLYSPTRTFAMKGQWQLDKSQVKPFDFP